MRAWRHALPNRFYIIILLEWRWHLFPIRPDSRWAALGITSNSFHIDSVSSKIFGDLRYMYVKSSHPEFNHPSGYFVCFLSLVPPGRQHIKRWWNIKRGWDHALWKGGRTTIGGSFSHAVPAWGVTSLKKKRGIIYSHPMRFEKGGGELIMECMYVSHMRELSACHHWWSITLSHAVRLVIIWAILSLLDCPSVLGHVGFHVCIYRNIAAGRTRRDSANKRIPPEKNES